MIFGMSKPSLYNEMAEASCGGICVNFKDDPKKSCWSNNQKHAHRKIFHQVLAREAQQASIDHH